MKLNEVKIGQIFQFVEKGLKFGICDLDGKFAYKTCNNKYFKYLGCAQFIEIKFITNKFISNQPHEIDSTLFNCFIHGRGENKKLFYECVNIIN